jgi:hypothetical protein
MGGAGAKEISIFRPVVAAAMLKPTLAVLIRLCRVVVLFTAAAYSCTSVIGAPHLYNYIDIYLRLSNLHRTYAAQHLSQLPIMGTALKTWGEPL